MGSPRVIVNHTGGVEGRMNYYPFGKLWERGQAPVTRWNYNGKETQEITGTNLLDYGARQYDPDLLRWKAVDPLAEKYYSMSPYNYVANNPVMNIDVDGLFPAGFASKLAAKELAKRGGVAGGVVLTGYIAAQEFSERYFATDLAWKYFFGVELSSKVDFLTDLSTGTTPEQWREQKRRERQAELDVARMTKTTQRMTPDGDPRGGKPRNKIEEGILGVGAAAVIIHQLTNPDPSKDAHEAHLEKFKEDLENSQRLDYSPNAQEDDINKYRRYEPEYWNKITSP